MVVYPCQEAQNNAMGAVHKVDEQAKKNTEHDNGGETKVFRGFLGASQA